jgi:3-hydroxyisobutyrate dehydrogenase-like beta-hydroxyacid dehydrogenase
MVGNSTPTAGVIGLGDIGAGIAGALVQAGIPVVVCDLRPEATAPFAGTATVAGDAAELAASVDVIVVAVVNDAQVLSVLDESDGALSTAKVGSTVVVVSTVTTDTVDTVAELAGGRGVHVVDCGVSGGPGAAAQGELVSMVGGEEPVVEGLLPILEAFSSLVVRMGPLGSGLQAKLARNIVQYGSWLAAYEAAALAEAAGIDPAALARVIRASDKKIGGASTLMFVHPSATAFGPDDDPGLVGAMRAAAELAHKDLGAALQLADRLGVSLPLAAMTEARTDAMFGLGPDPARAGRGAAAPRTGGADRGGTGS